ncbi:SCAN domain-containing protein 3, partial [Stegodyphus mimosarum]
MARIMCGDESSKKLQKIPLSNDTIRLRINDMSFDIKNQLISAIKIAGLFSIQLDETTDVSKDAQLMVYVRYPGLTDIQEDILFCKPMSTTTTGEDIFLMVDSFFKEEGLNWNQCFSICTDGAAAMTASQKGFSTRAKQMNPQIISIHCLLHRQNLASKKLSPELCIVLDEIVAVVNFIKSRALNCRIFRELCFEFGAEYEHLLYYSEVRWLSRGKVVQRVLSLRTEVEFFFREKKHPLASKFSELKWITQVAYLSDILFEINNLNTSMQGRNHTIIELTEKITCFKNKLKLWRNKVEVKKLASFPTLNLLVEDNNIDITDFEIQKIIINHLEKLIADFDRYFPADDVFKYNWVRMPFTFDVSDLHEEFVNINQFQEQLIEIQSDQALRYNFYKNAESLCAFWLKLKTEKPIIVKEALKVLLPFSTTYMCEAGFSALCVIKNNYRNKLNPEIDIRCSLTSIQPRFKLRQKEDL